MPRKIKKSIGLTATESLLSNLCEKTFLGLWSYPNPFKEDGKEACDLIAVFENHVFLFFDRESKKFDDLEKDVLLQWKRWEKEVIQKQVNTAKGAKKYILENPNKLYLDAKQKTPLPIKIPDTDVQIHCIIVAHGASEACKNFSKENIYGSLAIVYCDEITNEMIAPFMVKLDRSDSIHIFDSHNLEIILGELDTFHDFSSYITEKERAVSSYDMLFYCGEEDLLANYFSNFDDKKDQHFIGESQKNVNGIVIAEGEWSMFIKSDTYKRKQAANKISYFWDDLLHRTCQYALAGETSGNGNVSTKQSAICEMAKEPRFMRRVLSEGMTNAIRNYPCTKDKRSRNMTFMQSFYADKAYVFLQFHDPNITDYENDYRPKRRKMLEIACGVAKNKFPQFSKIIGIAIDAPKHNKRNSEDFLLLKCEEWSDENIRSYEDVNKHFGFFNSPSGSRRSVNVSEFPKK